MHWRRSSPGEADCSLLLGAIGSVALFWTASQRSPAGRIGVPAESR
jgi:hypothetical protein